MGPIQVTSFYRFLPIDDDRLAKVKRQLEELGSALFLRGLVILSTEGINGTIAGSLEQNDQFETQLRELFGTEDQDFKRARCKKPPFRSYRVKVRPEIVTTKRPESVAVDGSAKKLSPEDWNSALKAFDPEHSFLLDTRNVYETRLGMFRGATDPGISNFQEFEDFLDRRDIPKNKRVYMYCTGGIRCEKAAVQMQRRGYEQVYQLDGGILRYLEQFPHQEFQGECFVFDGRVAVDQELRASESWVFCPHCGDPARNEIACEECRAPAKICESCSQDRARITCSKNCSYHLQRKRGA